MEFWNLSIFLLLILSYVCVHGRLSNDRDELLNWCLDSKSHKHKPGKEDSLHEECLPWKDHSCCTSDTAYDVHNTNLYNFTLDHCHGQNGMNMSESCRKYFFRNNCFYECEPHIGLWVVEINRKIAKQRFYKVPLCSSDCDAWWNACKDDYTCVKNWPRGFRFRNGHNSCPENAQCQTFSGIYENAKDFCESVWDDSFVYTADNLACMRLWFDGSNGNPNRHTAEYYINKTLNGGAENVESSNVNIVMLLLVNVIILFL